LNVFSLDVLPDLDGTGATKEPGHLHWRFGTGMTALDLKIKIIRAGQRPFFSKEHLNKRRRPHPPSRGHEPQRQSHHRGKGSAAREGNQTSALRKTGLRTR
jgi:hypothetical protein